MTVTLSDLLHHELDEWERAREPAPQPLTAGERARGQCASCGQPLDEAARWVPDPDQPSWRYPHCGHCLGA